MKKNVNVYQQTYEEANFLIYHLCELNMRQPFKQTNSQSERKHFQIFVLFLLVIVQLRR